MTNLWLVIIGLVTLAAVYVVLPVASDALRRFRAKRRVTCPETGTDAEVGVDARHAALTAAYGHPRPRVKGCSLWPERQGCDGKCLGRLEEAGRR